MGVKQRKVKSGSSLKRMLRPGILTRVQIAEQITAYLDLPFWDQKRGYCAEALKIIDIILKKVVSALQKGEEVEIKGFGTFKFRTIKARRIKNLVVQNKFCGIKTKEPTLIPETKYVFFQPATTLLALLNKDNPEKTYREKRILSRDISLL